MSSECSFEDVQKFDQPVDGFLCPLSANTAGIQFLSFTISDYESKETFFDIQRDGTGNVPPEFETSDEDSLRTITYSLPADILRRPAIATDLSFSVGPEPVRNFCMVERHYFEGELIKSFDFSFGFCIPGSTNTWQAVYDVPSLPEDLIERMIDKPFETVSDSFYFANGKLIMHNKALYRYFDPTASRDESKVADTGRPKHEGKTAYDDDDDCPPAKGSA